MLDTLWIHKQLHWHERKNMESFQYMASMMTNAYMCNAQKKSARPVCPCSSWISLERMPRRAPKMSHSHHFCFKTNQPSRPSWIRLRLCKESLSPSSENVELRSSCSRRTLGHLNVSKEQFPKDPSTSQFQKKLCKSITYYLSNSSFHALNMHKKNIMLKYGEKLRQIWFHQGEWFLAPHQLCLSGCLLGQQRSPSATCIMQQNVPKTLASKRAIRTM